MAFTIRGLEKQVESEWAAVLIQMIFDQQVHLRLFNLIGRPDRFVGLTLLSGATVNR